MDRFEQMAKADVLAGTNWFNELLCIHLNTPIVALSAGRFNCELYFTYENTTITAILKLFLLKDISQLVYVYIGCAVEQARPHLDYEFDSGFGSVQGPYFTAWTNHKVHFPVQYDGSEWISSVDRNPCCETTFHIGGG